MSKTLGNVVSEGLRSIREPTITTFTSGNSLEEEIIEEANRCVRECQEKLRHRWTLARTSFLTTDDITTAYVAVTKGSTTVNSVTSAGVSDDGFGSVAAGMYLRVGSDLTSYLISSVDTSATPDTLVIEKAYTGTTSTASACKFITDTYGITDTDFDEAVFASYGEGRSLTGLYGGSDFFIRIVDLQTLYEQARGNLHINTAGKPILMAQKAPNASDQPEFILWPYPASVMMIEVYFRRMFTSASTFATVLFGADAPEAAYDFVAFGCCERACMWDKQVKEAEYWRGRKNQAMARLFERENRLYQADNQLNVETYRSYASSGIEIRSQIGFDTKNAWR